MGTGRLSIRTLLLLTVSALTVIITLLALQEVYFNWRQLEKIRSLKEAVAISDKLFDATEKFSLERNIAYIMLHTSDRETINNFQPRLTESRQVADKAFEDAVAILQHYHFAELALLQSNIETKLADVRIRRQQIDRAMTLARGQREAMLSKHWFEESTALNAQIQDLWMEFVSHFTGIDPIVTQHLRYKHFLRIITDYIGRERATVSRLILENASPTPKEFAELLEGKGVIELSWKINKLLARQSGLYDAIAPVYKDAVSHYATLHDMVQNVFYVSESHRQIAYPISVDLWFEISAQAEESLGALKNASLAETQRYVEILEAHTQHVIALNLTLLFMALALCAYSFRVITRRVIYPINVMITALVQTMQGKAVTLAPLASAARRQDEIGKLANVLHAFQDNMQEIKRTSAELEHYTHALERSNQELDDFAYIASHDLKEPLRGLFNHASFLIEDYKDKLDEDGVRRLYRLSHLSQRMERLVNDLLYFSRLGRAELAIQETDPNEIIHEIEQMMEPFLKERNARIVIPRPIPSVVCDKPRVTEVFRNLITNAVKYNDKPERVIEVGFLEHVETKERRERDVFYVKDNGVGIEPEFYQEIFRIFKRLQRSTEEKETGTGAGLTFVKKIIERHNGRVWLDSEPGKGTTFYFNLNQGDTV